MIETILPPLQRSLLFAGVLLLVGVAAWRVFIGPRVASTVTYANARGAPTEPEAAGSLEARTSAFGLWISLALLPVWLLRLVVQLMGFRDPFVPVSEDLHFLVFETVWGAVWVAQAGVLGAFLVLFSILRSTHDRTRREAAAPAPRWTAPALAGLGLALALTLAMSSHAMAVPANRTLAVALDTSHTLAAGAWIGTLALILGLSATRGHRGTPLAAQLRAFSPLAMGAVAVLVVAGTLLARQHVESIENLWATAYGRILSLKIATAIVVMTLGFLNWRRGLPVLDSEVGHRSVRRRASYEVAVAALVIVLTAILTGTPMPHGTH